MADILLNFLTKKNLDINNCRGHSYDNASSMSGRYNGVQVILKRECKYAAFLPCCSHSLNLVDNQAFESCSRCNFVNGVYIFFYASTYRWQLLKSRCRLSLKGLPRT